MTTQERIIEYVAKCNEKTTYKHSKLDTTRLLYSSNYCRSQIYRYLSRYIAVDGEKMGDVIDLFKGIHYCYFNDRVLDNPNSFYEFKKDITNIDYVKDYIEETKIGDRMKLDLIIGRLNLEGYLVMNTDNLFRLLYDMLEEHYEQSQFIKAYEAANSGLDSEHIKGKPIIIGTRGEFAPDPDIFYNPYKEEEWQST